MIPGNYAEIKIHFGINFVITPANWIYDAVNTKDRECSLGTDQIG